MNAPIVTYCTNIHPARGLDDVRESLTNVASPLRERVAPGATLPIGLRLSDAESRELGDDAAVGAFGDFLAERRLRCVCMNGFPFGDFHSGAVKDRVHHPDWRSDARMDYTLRLARALAGLLPAGASGGISTSPLSYRPWVIGAAERKIMTENVARVALALLRLAEETGRVVHVDLEPEPDGVIETVGEFARWFEEELAPIARTIGVGAEALRTQVRLCLDACHLAVMREDPNTALDAIERVGARVGRVQVSNALMVRLGDGDDRRREIAAALAPFDEAVYLHQTIGSKRGVNVERWPDLRPALAEIESSRGDEWRVHFHVPIFWAGDDIIGTTREHLRATIGVVSARRACDLFEIETYTWNVLPARLRLGIVDSIEREWRWLEDVMKAIETEGSA